jgi:hypothetical protein
LFREAATKYLEEETKKSLHNDAQALRALDPFIGDLYLEQVHSGTLEPFVKYMRGKSRKAGTINRYIAVVRRILNLAARYWRDADTGLSWLETAPLFRLEKGPQRKPYPITRESATRSFAPCAGAGSRPTTCSFCPVNARRTARSASWC